jgi:hypothetical protein
MGLRVPYLLQWALNDTAKKPLVLEVLEPLKPKFLLFGASAGLERRGVQSMIHGQPTGEDKHVENQQPKREEHVVSFVK